MKSKSLKTKSARATFILLCRHDFHTALIIYKKRLLKYGFKL